MRGWVAMTAVVVLASVASAAAEPSRSVGLLPIRDRWASPNDVVLVTETLIELGGELGVDVVQLELGRGCWRDRACDVRAAKASGSAYVLSVEVTKTSSRRLHLAFRLINTATGSVRDLPLVRSQPAVLRAQIRRTMILIRDAIPQPEPPPQIAPPLTPPPVIVVAPPPPPVPEPAPAPTPWYQAISINAFVSVGYSYNMNRPPMAVNTLRVFDTTHEAATIDVAELVIQRAVGEPGDAGFRFDLVAGSAIPHLSAASGLFRDSMTGVAYDFDLQQAIASYIAPIGSGLRFDAGKFTSPAGAEVIEGYDGFNDHYSRSLLFGYAVPFTHTGIRISYPFSDRVSATLFGINGWDVVRDNNGAPSYGAQLTILPVSDVTIAATYLGGPERTGDDRVLRHLGDLVASWKLNPQVVLTTNLDYGKDGGQRWYGAAAYLRLDLARRFTVALRGERFWDLDGARTGTAQRLWETTLTTAFRLATGFTFRLELRYDHSGQPVFAAFDGDRRFQLTIAANAVYAL